MMKQQQLVREFHRATGAHRGDMGAPGFRNVVLRLSLMQEELDEITDAAGYVRRDGNYFWENEQDLISAVDGLGDLLYVLLGTAVEWGIDLEPYFDEIHASNMTKVGGEVRADGKRLKGKNYRPPNLTAVYEQQLADYAKTCRCGGNCHIAS